MRDAAPHLGYRASCRDSAPEGKAADSTRPRKHRDPLVISAAWANLEWFETQLTFELPGQRIHMPRKTE
jgi:hypothetical protein